MWTHPGHIIVILKSSKRRVPGPAVVVGVVRGLRHLHICIINESVILNYWTISDKHYSAEYFFLHDLKCVWRGSLKKQSKKKTEQSDNAMKNMSVIAGNWKFCKMSKVWGVSLAALRIAGVWFSSRPWSLGASRANRYIVLLWKIWVLAPLRMLKCHWGRHWITTGSGDTLTSLSYRWDPGGGPTR